MLLVRDELRHAASAGGNVLTVGVFDGVHRGHQTLVARTRDEARRRGLGAGVATFHPNPLAVLRPDVAFSYLTSLERRVELLREAGADWVAVVQFTSELALVSAEDFARMLVEDAGMRLLIVGEDFRLGRGREGDVTRLRELGVTLGFEVETLPLVAGDLDDTGGADEISSTRIRRALAASDMRAVTVLLGRPFSLRGPVIHGDERGRAIGFPTLNIGVSADHALPPDGVYVTRAQVQSGQAWGHVFHGATNIGTQPTFDGARRRVETHLLDFEGDLYGQVVQIELVDRLRDEQKFDGIESLVAQIQQDIVATRAYFA